MYKGTGSLSYRKYCFQEGNDNDDGKRFQAEIFTRKKCPKQVQLFASFWAFFCSGKPQNYQFTLANTVSQTAMFAYVIPLHFKIHFVYNENCIKILISHGTVGMQRLDVVD